jgi:outer membrane receptor protein involved in Fe transport
LTVNYLHKNQRWSAGIESGIKERQKDKNATENDKEKARAAKDFYNAKEVRWNAFLINDITIGKHIFSPALRWEITDLTSVSQFLDAKKVLVTSEKKHHFQTLNPIINYVWRTSEAINLRGSVARTVRRPKFDDLAPYIETKAGTLLNPDNQGNPDLLPETSLGFDAGMDYFFGKNNELGVIGLNFFNRNITDFMENQTNLDPLTNRYVTTPTNAGNGNSWGIELDFRYETSLGRIGRLIPKANGSWLNSKLLDTKTQQYRKFKGQPDYVYNIGFEYLTNNKKISFGANYNEVPIANEAETKADGSYEVKEITSIRRLDLFINYSLSKKIALRLGGQNLLTKAKTVYKRVYLADNSLSNYDIERELFTPTYMLSLQWNIK